MLGQAPTKGQPSDASALLDKYDDNKDGVIDAK